MTLQQAIRPNTLSFILFLTIPFVLSCTHSTPTPPPDWSSYTTGNLQASARGAAQRVLIIDENDQVIQVWSNTTRQNGPTINLRVREATITAPDHPFTPAIRLQYDRLFPLIDWSRTGLVWTSAQ